MELGEPEEALRSLTFQSVAEDHLQRLAERDQVVVAVPNGLRRSFQAMQHA